MAIRHLSAAKITSVNEVLDQLDNQSTSNVMPRSTDPQHYPVFEIPVNKKVLIYVPNHTVQDENGVEHLRMDKPLLHTVKDGNRYLTYRCIRGIVDEADGFDGTCPLCDGVQEPWDYANELIKSQCADLGLDPNAKENPQVKEIRRKAFTDRVIKASTRYYTFPIVVFETKNDDAKTFERDENNRIKYHIEWYTISENTYKDKWGKCLEALEDDPTHPGGRFYILNYTYTPKSGQPNRRDSARNLTVSAKSIKNSAAVKTELDKETEDWTPAKAVETVVNNALYTVKDLTYVANTALEPTREALALIKAKELGGGASVNKLEENSTPVSITAPTETAKQEVGETDADDGELGF